MIEIIAIIITIAVLLISFLIYFFKLRKSDVTESSEIKTNTSGIRQPSQQTKKTKRKIGKKDLRNDSDPGSHVEDVTTENEAVEILGSLPTKEETEIIEELTVPLKAAEESAVPSLKKKKNKAKNLSGDQNLVELKRNDVEKNDNQSNTLLGRSNDDKLKEDILGLQKKVDDLENEKSKNDISLENIQKLLADKEKENDLIKSNLSELSNKLKEAQHDLSAHSVDKDKTKKDLKQLKERYDKDSMGHKDMYMKYDQKIEQLKAEVKDRSTETDRLNKQLKEEVDRKNEIQKQLEKVNAVLKEKSDELNVKCGNFNKLQGANEQLKHSIEELKKSLTNENSRLKEVADTVSRNLENKSHELAEKIRIEASLNEEISLLNRNVDKLNKEVQNKEECLNRLRTIETEKKGLEERVFALNVEAESNIREIERLNEKNKENCVLEDRLKESDANYNEIMRQKVAMAECVDQLQKALDHREGELTSARKNESIAHQSLASLKEDIHRLHVECAAKEEASAKVRNQMTEEIERQNKSIKTLQLEVEAGHAAMEVLRQAEEAANHTLEEQKKKMTDLEDLKIKNTHLECINHDLKRENFSKIAEIDALRQENQTLLLASAVVKEEETPLRSATSEDRTEVEELRVELAKRETQVESLIQHTSTLANDNKALEKRLAAKAEELAGHAGSAEVDSLKNHVGKLEKELIEMQGRYHVLKEASMLDERKEKHPTLNTNSEMHIVNIPPTSQAPEESHSPQQHNNLTTHGSLQEAIDRLNSEIEEQRLTNKKLSGHLSSKENEVNMLRQCLLGLDGNLSSIGNMANELQRSCTLSQQEKGVLVRDHDSLVAEHEALVAKYRNLEGQLAQLNASVAAVDVNHDDRQIDDKMVALCEENEGLRARLEQYRDSLERTEQMLERIQSSVDREEAVWKAALRSSEEECGLLGERLRGLAAEVEELRRARSNPSDDHEGTTDENAAGSVNNGLPSMSESKKKRKRKNKNKKKKNKNRGPAESNGGI